MFTFNFAPSKTLIEPVEVNVKPGETPGFNSPYTLSKFPVPDKSISFNIVIVVPVLIYKLLNVVIEEPPIVCSIPPNSDNFELVDVVI